METHGQAGYGVVATGNGAISLQDSAVIGSALLGVPVAAAPAGIRSSAAR